MHHSVPHIVCWALFLLSFLQTGHEAAAQTACKEGGELVALVNNADTVVIVEELEDQHLPLPGLRARQRSFVRFIQFIKPPLFTEFDRTKAQAVYLEDLPYNPRAPFSLILRKRKHLAFLSYLETNAWITRRCRYLEISPGNMVEEACTAIADLFGDNAYERERRCLLSYPPSAPLSDVDQEIVKLLRRDEKFTGTGRFASNGRWINGVDYQFVVINLDPRSRKEFFGRVKNLDQFPIKAYIKTEQLSPTKFEKYALQGKKFSFSGTWNQGSFVIDSIEWMSGRRPLDGRYR
jgi:hypothetical protein